MNPHPSLLPRQRQPRPALVLTAVMVFLGIPSTAWGVAQDGPTRLDVSKQERLRQLEQAQFFIDRDTSRLDLRGGPVDGLTFDPATVVSCEYYLPGIRLGGATPKFLCRVGGTVYKVKYLPSERYGTTGKNRRSADREIYGEMAATRLFWALGFGADRVFLTYVVCHGCPASPHDGPDEREQRTRAFSRSVRPIGVALIEQRFEGATIVQPERGADRQGGVREVLQDVLDDRDRLELLAASHATCFTWALSTRRVRARDGYAHHGFLERLAANVRRP